MKKETNSLYFAPFLSGVRAFNKQASTIIKLAGLAG